MARYRKKRSFRGRKRRSRMMSKFRPMRQRVGIRR